MALTLNGSTNTIGGLAVGGLPDGIVDTDMLAANAVVSGKITDGTIVSGDISGGLPAAGLTGADCWIVDSDFSGGGGTQLYITNDWTQPTGGSGGNMSDKIGTGMTESSGVFTFPSTGVWYIHFISVAYDNQSSEYMWANIIGTDDNWSSSEYLANGGAFINRHGGNCYMGVATEYLFNVTNTTNCKVKFSVTAENNMTWGGHADRLDTGAIFMRLGDT